MVESSHHSGFDFDQLNHRAKHVGSRPTGFLPRKVRRSRSCPEDKGYVRRCKEGHERLQGSLYLERCNAPFLSVDRRKAILQELTKPSNRICSRPRKEVRKGPTYELGQILGEPTRTRLQGSAGPGV
jgi:hypothetical protein